MQEQEKEIFQNYEIKNWNYAPRLYKIFAAAAALNLLAILVLGQTNLLTQKGCDSPFVNRVCQVIDTVYVGSMLLGTDTEFVSKDYQKTELEDADITFIELSNEKPFAYPEGYFAPSPDQLAMMQNPINDFSMMPSVIPGIPMNPTITGGTNLINTPQTLPTPNKKAIVGDLAESPFSIGGPNPIPAPKMNGVKRPPIYSQKMPKFKNNLPNVSPNAEDKTTAENKNKSDNKQADPTQPEIKSDPVADIEINKKPFEELGDNIIDKVSKKEVDLTKPFLVILDGTITTDGKLDRNKSRFVKFEGDQQMIDVAKKTIEAVGDSGFLAYLKANGIDRVNFMMVQDDKQIYIKIVSDQKDLYKARTTASGFNTLISGIKLLDENGLKKLDENSKTLINNSKVTSDGKNFILNFTLPKQDAQDIITRTLKQYAEKKAKQQPNSTAQTDNANLKTAK